MKPLSAEWRINHGIICCGTLRIAKMDYDTNPSDEFKQKLEKWICDTLNMPAPNPSGVRAGMLKAADAIQRTKLNLAKENLPDAVMETLDIITESIREVADKDDGK